MLLLLACAARETHTSAPTLDSKTAHLPAAESATAPQSTHARASVEDAAATGKAEDVFFAALPLQATPKVTELAASAKDNTTFAKNLRIRMHVMRGYRNLGELTHRSGLPLVNGVFQISDLSHLASRDKAAKAYKQASFVVDFEEPAISVPSRALDALHPKAAPDDVARFVSEYIEEKSYQRAFDVASRVAESRAGDCTEHAVLTAALLRKRHVPARLILGIVVLAVSHGERSPHLMAVGHSWVEYHDGNSWQVADAALRPDDARPASRTGAPGVYDSEAQLRFAYLPIKVMKDEGIGFARALMDDVGVESVLRVELDAASPD